MEISKLNPAALTGVQTNKTQPTADLLNNMGQSFEEVLKSLSQSQNQTDDLMARMSAGEDIDIHDIMIATEENDVNFRIALAIRNKLVDAYREIRNMPI